MSSSSHDDYQSPIDSSQPIAGSTITPVAQQPAPPPWVKYPSFLPADPSAMATGLTPQMANAIDKYSQPAYLTPTEVAGGTQERAGPSTPTLTTPAPAALTPAAPVGITRAELGNKPTGQMLALLGTDNRTQLADLLRRANNRSERASAVPR